MDRRVPALAALLVAALLVATPLYLYPHAGQDEYHHSVERIDRSEIPSEVEVRHYETLSDEGKRAFDAALADPEGRAVVHGEANRPPEFFYSDYADYGQGIYVIEKGGEYYRLETYAGGGLFPADLFAAAALAVLAGAVALVGAVGWRRERTREPAVAAGGGLAVLVAVAAADATAGNVVGLLVALGAAVLGWFGVGATHRPAAALGGAAGVGSLLVAVTLAARTGGTVTLVAGVAVVLVVATGLGAVGRWGWRRAAA
ncbi:MAG: hypothetical protein ABEH47_03695 [Haloferacaceae archaeon]